jgi:hypothetical protein
MGESEHDAQQRASDPSLPVDVRDQKCPKKDKDIFY